MFDHLADDSFVNLYVNGQLTDECPIAYGANPFAPNHADFCDGLYGLHHELWNIAEHNDAASGMMECIEEQILCDVNNGVLCNSFRDERSGFFIEWHLTYSE